MDTFDPVIDRSLISYDKYFYCLTLKGKYTPENCPDYLSEKGYNNLTSKNKTTKETPVDNIMLHTDSLNDVFARLRRNSLSIAIIMDHMDSFDPKGYDAVNEITTLKNCLNTNGRVLLRSVSTNPWYIKTFENLGFSCTAACVRETNISIDRINMYASTWVCTKFDDQIPTNRRRMSNLKI